MEPTPVAANGRLETTTWRLFPLTAFSFRIGCISLPSDVAREKSLPLLSEWARAAPPLPCLGPRKALVCRMPGQGRSVACLIRLQAPSRRRRASRRRRRASRRRRRASRGARAPEVAWAPWPATATRSPASLFRGPSSRASSISRRRVPQPRPHSWPLPLLVGGLSGPYITSRPRPAPGISRPG